MFFKTLIAILSVSSLIALDPPNPIQGTASYVTGSGRITMGSGDYEFNFTFPSGWGIGSSSISPSGTGEFEVFPQSGGYGCNICIQTFENNEKARDELAKIKATFSSTQDIEGGFEIELKKAWCACYIQDQHLIEVWYSLPKKQPNSKALWDQLKKCVTIKNAKEEFQILPYSPVVESPQEGWICNDPSNTIHVLFKSWPIIRCKPNSDPNYHYQLCFRDIFCSGYFYILWDIENTSIATPYKTLLSLMKADIDKLNPSQRFEKQPIIKNGEGYGLWNGNPYYLITIESYGFLFGFAIKNENGVIQPNINELIDKVKYWKDQN